MLLYEWVSLFFDLVLPSKLVLSVEVIEDIQVVPNRVCNIKGDFVAGASVSRHMLCHPH